MNYAALAASDGSGEAVRATVQSPGRDVGSSAIPVDATTNWPSGTFIATTGTLQVNNTLTNAQVFYGTASGTTITITSFAPGYSDLGNSIGDVVVLKPTTEWANIVSAGVQSFIGTGVPTGALTSFAGATAPTGWLLCQGQAVSRTTYAALFAICSTTYGSGDGSTTFNLPNLQGNVPVGYKSGDANFGTLGATGGEKTHVLTTTEIPSHTHTLGAAGSTKLQGSGTSMSPLVTDGGNANSGSTGGGGAHNNLQPFLTLQYIIKT